MACGARFYSRLGLLLALAGCDGATSANDASSPGGEGSAASDAGDLAQSDAGAAPVPTEEGPEFIPIFHGNIEYFANNEGKPLVDCFFDPTCIGPIPPSIITLSECPAGRSGPFMEYLNSKSDATYKLWATPAVLYQTGAKCIIFNERYAADKASDWTEWRRWQTPNNAWSSTCVRAPDTDRQHYRVRLLDTWTGKHVRVVGIHPEAIEALDECGHVNGDQECAVKNVSETLVRAQEGPEDALRIVVGDWNYVNRCALNSWYATQCIKATPGCFDGEERAGYPPAYQMMVDSGFRDVFGDDAIGRNSDNGYGSNLNIDHLFAISAGRDWPWHADDKGAGILSPTSRMIRRDVYGADQIFSDHWKHWFGLAYY